MREEHQLLLQEYSAVQQALAELAAIYNDAPVGLAVIDTDFRFQRINARLAEINGLPVEAHIGRSVREVLPKLADIAEALIRNVAATGEPLINHEIEGETAAQPGVIRSFIEHWSPITGPDGSVVAVNIVVEEVTARRRAEEALRASEVRLRDVLDSIREAFLVMDRDFRIIQMNGAALRIDGRTFEELRGRTYWQAWPASTGTPLEAAYRRAMNERVPMLLEHRFVTDTRDVWLDISVYPTADGIAAFYRDISERKHAEELLKQNESRLATALRAGHLGVFEYAYRPRPGYVWDQTVRRIWGVMSDEAITDDHFWASLHPEDAPKVMAIYDRTLTHAEPNRVDLEYRIYRLSDHKLRWVSVALDVLFDEAGPVKMIGTVRDITERKAAQEHAQLLMREVNHRSKNLLAVVQSIAHQMARDADPATFAASFSERLAGLASCHDLLVNSQWKGVDLTSLVISQLPHFKPLLGGRLHLEGPVVRISANATQSLGMALHELATNAAKYGALSDERGEVTIAWTLTDLDGDRRFDLSWTEAKGPPVTAPVRKGLGSHIITRLLKHSLNGEVTLDFAPSGLRWSLSAPAGDLVE